MIKDSIIWYLGIVLQVFCALVAVSVLLVYKQLPWTGIILFTVTFALFPLLILKLKGFHKPLQSVLAKIAFSIILHALGLLLILGLAMIFASQRSHFLVLVFVAGVGLLWLLWVGKQPTAPALSSEMTHDQPDGNPL